ncbi:MAG TPA: choice-of-anchor L domain-containing protein, partial [Bacteroidales bacterium]|nr:choice-of-anchor L domain-containing protein [Bacteroidales bacterium]
PISINNVNATSNAAYYHDNTGGQLVEFDGYTVPMPLLVPVTLGNTYRLKIAIADAGDGIYDSGIFLKKNSLIGFAMQPIAGFTPSLNGPVLTLTNTSQYARYYEWDFGDGNTLADSSQLPVNHTYASTGQFQVRLVAHNFYKSDTATEIITVTATGVQEQALSPMLRPLADRQWEISFPDAAEAQLSISGVDGRMIKRVEKPQGAAALQVDLRNESPGLYIIRCTQSGHSGAFKVIVH